MHALPGDTFIANKTGIAFEGLQCVKIEQKISESEDAFYSVLM